ncbi:hypothetical protein [Natrinema salaciae]|uniref:Uncharacterized protein n=1 Tax=Natrinema salaciae TaxID=1186196 RepID=A0A1H9JNH9_9EURY|nr:hypothetical protein [Natrinema salaciae]SEQ88366.1 hypothetical protein SAMN04489841_2630 [Natrinema salaciae]
MYLGLHQKAVIAAVGLLFCVLILVMFPWWLGIFALIAMIPFFGKVLFV